MFTADNTAGYAHTELAQLNAELLVRLTGVERNSDLWHQIVKAFADEIASR